MPKQQITIEVDGRRTSLDILVPDGKEISRVWESGTQHNGGELVAISVTLDLREAWQWPSWLKAEWIAMDGDGRWFAYGEEPVAIEKADDRRFSGRIVGNLQSDFIDFTPPPCTDWRQSKRRRPV